MCQNPPAFAFSEFHLMLIPDEGDSFVRCLNGEEQVGKEGSTEGGKEGSREGGKQQGGREAAGSLGGREGEPLI